MMKLQNELKGSLYPLYEELLKNNTCPEIYPFCVQWGKKYPAEKNKGLLFVGISKKNWISISKDVKVLFGESNDSIFAKSDQMQWVQTNEGAHSSINTKMSKLWRIIKSTAQQYHSGDSWFENVAWTNLYKIVSARATPTRKIVFDEQLKSCLKIFEQEIAVLSPKFVIMFASGWDMPFLTYLNGNKPPKSLEAKKWDDVEVNIYKIKDTYYIASVRPESLREHQHVDAITSLINKY